MKHIIIILSIIFLVISCNKKGSDKHSNKKKSKMSKHFKGKKKKTKIQKQVRVDKVKLSKIIKYKNFNTILQPKKDVFVNTQSSGIITKLNFDMGKQVKKGELLAVIDTRLKKIDLDLKKVLKEEAAVQLKYQESLLKKDEILLNKKILTKEAYELSKNRFTMAKFVLDKSKLSYNLARIMYNNSFVYAPFDGLIVSRLKQKGDIASIGMPLGRIIDNKNLETIIGVTWEDLNHIKSYSKDKKIIVVAPDNKACKSFISGVSENLDDITKLYPIKLSLENCSFVNGTQVKIDVPIKEYENTVEVKRDILNLEDNKYYLFILKDNKAIKTKVDLIDDNRDKMIIRIPNIKNEEISIITDGHIGLIDKEKVIIAGYNESN